jgi:hypothetical protein
MSTKSNTKSGQKRPRDARHSHDLLTHKIDIGLAAHADLHVPPNGG